MVLSTLTVAGETVALRYAIPVLLGQGVAVSDTAPMGSLAPPTLQDPAGHEAARLSDDTAEHHAQVDGGGDAIRARRHGGA